MLHSVHIWLDPKLYPAVTGAWLILEDDTVFFSQKGHFSSDLQLVYPGRRLSIGTCPETLQAGNQGAFWKRIILSDSFLSGGAAALNWCTVL